LPYRKTKVLEEKIKETTRIKKKKQNLMLGLESLKTRAILLDFEKKKTYV